jgi:hypothetical protein
MTGDQPGHLGAMAVAVRLAVAARLNEVLAIENASGEIRVIRNSSVDYCDSHSLAGADALSLYDVEELQMPLPVSNSVGSKSGTAQERGAGRSQRRCARSDETPDHLE